MKTCSKCGFPKEISEFNKQTSSKDGHSLWWDANLAKGQS